MKTLKNILRAMTILLTTSCAVHAGGPKTSQDIHLDQAVSVNGQALKAGDAEVRWVTHSPQATVTFVQRKSTLTADGVFVTRDQKADRDAVVYRINPDGSRSLIELQFGGSNKVLSFDPAVIAATPKEEK
jgi:lipopolysaccharide export system protein LptA